MNDSANDTLNLRHSQPFSGVQSSPKFKSYKPTKCTICCFIFLLFVAIVCFILAILLPSIIQDMVHKQIEQQIPLRVNDSLTYSPWVSPPTPVYMQFWVFDVMNPDEVISNGAKPFLKQKGPITYLEKRLKTDIVFHDNNATVSYREVRTFHYQPQLSVLKETDNFTNINLPLLVFGAKIRYVLPSIHKILEDVFKMLDKDGLFIQKTVGEAIWGYKDPALETAAELLKFFGIHIDPMVGIFYGKNGSDDGRYNVYTGTDNLSQFVHIHTWKDQASLSMWSSDECNEINGTDGTMFNPFVDKSKRQYIFTSDLCRSIYAEYVQDSSILDVPTYLFTAPESVFAAPSDNPDNAGFCIPNCLPAGLLNMTYCIPDAPVIMSPPHFYQTDSSVLNLVDGLAPSDDCRTELNLEPTTGLVLNAQKKLQINMGVEPVSGFPDMAKLPPVLYLPYVWLNESAVVDEESAAQLRSSVVLAARFKSISPIVLYALGGVLMSICILILVIVLMKRSFYSRDPSCQILINESTRDHTITSHEHV
jgi:lysosome membrane protein 2